MPLPPKTLVKVVIAYIVSIIRLLDQSQGLLLCVYIHMHIHVLVMCQDEVCTYNAQYTVGSNCVASDQGFLLIELSVTDT